MICDLPVVQPANAPLNSVFSSFVIFLLFEGVLVGFWSPLQVHDSRELVSSLLVVLYLCGNPFIALAFALCSFPPPPLLGMIFCLCF